MVSDFSNFSKYLSYLPFDTNNHNFFALNKQQKFTSNVDFKYSGNTVKSSRKNEQDKSKNIKDNLGFIINKLHKVYDNLNPVISKANNNILEVIIHDFDFIKYDQLSTCSLTDEQYQDILEASTLLQDLNNNFIKDAQAVTKFDPRQRHFYQRNFIVNLVYETTYKNFKSLSNSFIKRETLNVLVELYNSLQSSICTLNEIIENQQIVLKIPLGVEENQNLLEESKENLKEVTRIKSDLIFHIDNLKKNNKLAILIEESESGDNSNESINVKLCKIKSEVTDEVDSIISESYVSAFNCILENDQHEASVKNSSEILSSSSTSLTYGNENPNFSTHCSTCEEVVPVYTEESLTSSDAPITIIDSSCCLKSSIPFLKRLMMKSKSLSHFKESDYSFFNTSLKSFLTSSMDKISLNFPIEDKTNNIENLKKKFCDPCVVISIKSQCFPSDMNKDDEIDSNKNFPLSSKSSYHSLRYTEGNLILIKNVPSHQNVLSYNSVSRSTTVPTSDQISCKTDKSSKNISKKFKSLSTIVLNPKNENIPLLNKKEQPETKEDNANILNSPVLKSSEKKTSEKTVETSNNKILVDAHTSKSMLTIPAKYENLTLLSTRYHKKTNKSNFSIKYIKTSSDTLLVKSNPIVLPLNKNKNICLVKEMDVPYEASTTSIPKEDNLPKRLNKSKKHKTRKTNLKTKQSLKKHLPYTISNTSLPREDDHYYKPEKVKNKILSKFNYYANLANISNNGGNPSYDIYCNALLKNESSKNNVYKPYFTKHTNKEVNELNSDSGINSDPNNTESFTNDLPWGLQIFEVRVVGMERNRTSESSENRRISTLSEASTTASTAAKSKYYDYPEEPVPDRFAFLERTRDSSFQRRDTTSVDFENFPFPSYSGPRESTPLAIRPWAPLQTSDISLPREGYEGKSRKSIPEKPKFTDNEAQVSSILPEIINKAAQTQETPYTSADMANIRPNYVPFQLVPVSMIRGNGMQSFSMDPEADAKMLPFILTDLNQVRQKEPLNLANVSCENPTMARSLTGIIQSNASTQTDDTLGSMTPKLDKKKVPSKTCQEATCGTSMQRKTTTCKASGTVADNNLNSSRVPPHPCCCMNKKYNQGSQITPTTSTVATATCCGNCPARNSPQNPYKNCTVYHNPNTYYSFIDVRKPKCFTNRNKKLFKNDYLNELVQASSEKLLNNKMKSETQSQSLSKIHNCKFSKIDKTAIGMEGDRIGKSKTNTEKLKTILNETGGLKKNVCNKKFPINSDTILESITKNKSKTNDKLVKLNGRLCASDTDACTSCDRNKMKIANKYCNYMHEQEKLSKHSLLKKMLDYNNKDELKKKKSIKFISKEELKLKRCPSSCNIFNINVNSKRVDRHHNGINTRVQVDDALNNLKIDNWLGQSDLRKISYHAASSEFSPIFLKRVSNCQTLQTKPKRFNFEECRVSIEPSLEKFNLSSTICNFPLYGFRFGNSNDSLVNDSIKCLNRNGNSKFDNHLSNSDSRLYVRVNKNCVYDNMARICSSMKGYQNDELRKIYYKIKRCCKIYKKTLKQLTTRSSTNVLLNDKLDTLLDNEQDKDNGRILIDLIALKTSAQSLLTSPNILISSFEEALLDNLITLIADNIRKYSENT